MKFEWLLTPQQELMLCNLSITYKYLEVLIQLLLFDQNHHHKQLSCSVTVQSFLVLRQQSQPQHVRTTLSDRWAQNSFSDLSKVKDNENANDLS